MKKQCITAMLSLSMAVAGATMTAYADGWELDSIGWWYKASSEPMGCYCNGWYWVDGNSDGVAESYYFDSNGYILSGVTTPDGYVVNKDGAWVENGIVQTREVEVKKNETGLTSGNNEKIEDNAWAGFEYEGVYPYVYEETGVRDTTSLTVTRNEDGTFHFVAKHEDMNLVFYEVVCQLGEYKEFEMEYGDGTKETTRNISFYDLDGDEVAAYYFNDNSMAIWPGFELTYFHKTID